MGKAQDLLEKKRIKRMISDKYPIDYVPYTDILEIFSAMRQRIEELLVPNLDLWDISPHNVRKLLILLEEWLT